MENRACPVLSLHTGQQSRTVAETKSAILARREPTRVIAVTKPAPITFNFAYTVGANCKLYAIAGEAEKGKKQASIYTKWDMLDTDQFSNAGL